ncbi:3-oxoacyl-ACP synthase III family protein [Kutzneria sp. CA-103260]|uniref:3-oxoacyl-ACP synthase III family protein n=1 Tax=Kutzneria sp. CA-103260 TaxID=2802641 RepID=UPI001BAC8D4B|nr:3-oxoacyl-[acyl-carrier-protein] synthase III C-terminal domain-containing protein [Kutzneria sp. CA-103260]QUQ67048.1 3-oxoacyl-ACP synthase [Kutzneria sp. CA-103260]
MTAFGIAGIGAALGRRTRVADVALEYTEDLRRLRAWGFRSFHEAEPDVQPNDLAVRAAEAALARTGIAATELDAVVLCTTGPSEYLYWDAAAAVQGRIGACNAEVLLVSHACTSTVMAFDLVAGKFATHADYRTVLVVGVNRVCEPYWNRMDSNTAVFSDGAAAAVLRRGESRCQWLVTETVTDGSLADLLLLDRGGVAQPWEDGEQSPAPVAPAVQRLQSFYGEDTAAMQRFGELTVQRTKDVVLRACKRADIEASSIARLIHLNDNIVALSSLAAALDIPLARTNAEIAMEHGHAGCADQLLTLDLHLSGGALVEGDLVALTAMGSGMHWSCTLLRV